MHHNSFKNTMYIDNAMNLSTLYCYIDPFNKNFENGEERNPKQLGGRRSLKRGEGKGVGRGQGGGQNHW